MLFKARRIYRLPDRLITKGNRGKFNDRLQGLLAIISTKLSKGPLRFSHMGQNSAFQHNLCVSKNVKIYSFAGNNL
ncbi:hypothetical protein D3C87_2116080 [compost metagenome]